MLKQSVNKVGNESTYFGDKIAALHQENNEMQSTITKLKQEQTRLKTDCEDSFAKRSAMAEELSKAKEALINLQTKHNLLQSDKDRLALDVQQKATTIEHLNNDRESLSKLLENNKRSWDSNDMRVAELARENSSLNDALVKLNAEISRLNEEKRCMGETIDDLRSK